MNKNTKMKKNVKKMGVNDPIVTAPKIDKVSGVVDLKDQKLNGMAFSGMLDWLLTGEQGVVKVPVAGKYQLAVKIHYPDGQGLIHNNGPALLLQITNPKLTKRQARFEYNPVQMTEAGRDYLDVMFTELFAQEFYQFLYHARFTRVDFCRDILNQDPEDYLFKVKWMKTSQSFSADGKLKTLNLGSSAANQVTIYDKAAQLHGKDATHSTTRIEVKLRINLKINGLAKLGNPFERVEVYALGCKNPPFGQALLRAFQDSCRLRGITNALKRQPVSQRAVLKKWFSELPVAWWQMEPADWDFLLTEALENAGLLNIPNYAPSLSLANGIGWAA